MRLGALTLAPAGLLAWLMNQKHDDPVRRGFLDGTDTGTNVLSAWGDRPLRHIGMPTPPGHSPLRRSSNEPYFARPANLAAGPGRRGLVYAAAPPASEEGRGGR